MTPPYEQGTLGLATAVAAAQGARLGPLSSGPLGQAQPVPLEA